MKKTLSLLFFLITFLSYSQFTTINPDTVCYQTPGSIYQVPNNPAYTYNWIITPPGVIVAGQGTNQIGVDWSAAAPGLIINAVEVTSQNANGCESVPTLLDVFIYDVTPVITTIGPFCVTDPCFPLTAAPAGGTFTGPGVVGSDFCPNVAGAGAHQITYTYTNGGCVFIATINIVVSNQPVLSPIEHN